MGRCQNLRVTASIAPAHARDRARGLPISACPAGKDKFHSTAGSTPSSALRLSITCSDFAGRKLRGRCRHKCRGVVCDGNTTASALDRGDGRRGSHSSAGSVVIKVNGGRGGVFAWDVKIFEHRRRDDYKLIGEIIEETAIQMQRILTALRAHFTEVKVFDPEGARPSDRSERLYFVCKTRAK